MYLHSQDKLQDSCLVCLYKTLATGSFQSVTNELHVLKWVNFKRHSLIKIPKAGMGWYYV